MFEGGERENIFIKRDIMTYKKGFDFKIKDSVSLLSMRVANTYTMNGSGIKFMMMGIMIMCITKITKNS